MSNADKSALLGLNFSTASQRLRKMLLWRSVVEMGQDQCFRCGKQIENIDDLSIEHKESWQGADDPKAAFFDLNNITFSHLSCNCGQNQRDREHCPQGHAYDEANTLQKNGSRYCRICDRQRGRRNWHRYGYAARRRVRRMEARLKVG